MDVAALGAGRPPIPTEYRLCRQSPSPPTRGRRRPAKRSLWVSRQTSTIGLQQDANRSDFDEAAWNDSARPRPSDSQVESLVEEVLAASADDRDGRRVAAFASDSAATAFEPRLMWERFVRRPSSKVPDDSDETSKGQDWEHWGLTDLLLLLAIVNIGLVLLVTMVAPFSSWSGMLLAVLASAVTFRTTRAGSFKLDKCNQAFTILIVLLVCSMLPGSWAWRDYTMLSPCGADVAAGLFRLLSRAFGNLNVI